MIGLLFGILPLLCDLWTWMSTREWPVGWILTRWIYSLFLFIFLHSFLSLAFGAYIYLVRFHFQSHAYIIMVLSWFLISFVSGTVALAFYTDFPFHVFLCLRSPFGLLQASWLAFCTFRDTHHTT